MPGPDATPEERRAYRASLEARSDVQRRNRRRRVMRRAIRRPFLHGFRWMLGLLPPLAAALLGHALGTLTYYVSKRLRNRVRKNLDLAYGDTLSEGEKRGIARRSIAYAGRGGLTLVSLARRGPERALKLVRFEGLERLDEALAEGKGAILVSFHYGFFDMLAVYGTQRLDGAFVSREVPEGSPTALLDGMRRDIGINMLHRGDTRTLLRVLKKNRPLGLVADHDVSDVKGCFVPFFGHLAHTPLGPAALSIRTGAPIVAGVIEWEGWTRHLIRVDPVLRPRNDLEREDAILDLTHRYTQLAEAHIRRRPDQWLWMHKRWATRPEQHPDRPVWDGDPD